MVAPAFLIPLPFLLAFALALLLPKRRWLGYIGALAGALTLIIVVAAAQSTGIARLDWFSVAGVDFYWSVMVDNLSMLLSGIVAGIGVCIFIYSVGYLEPSEDLNRFYAVLALFAAAMLAAVTSENLFQLFFSWELVGVSSYLLIGFWHDRESAIAAARRAFMTVILGDVFLLCGILLLHAQYGTFSIPAILASATGSPTTMFAGICIIVGAISKSAQFPLHAWLPDAMEGPTPVSAFLHSATMVKAGLFLIARMLPLLLIAGLSPLILAIAILTMLISAACALVENDIKRVLAYSTMNQLAFILLALGLGAAAQAMLHLLNHSIFKALLFLAAGCIIHLAGTQDITKMSVKQGWNVLAITTLIGVIALAGLPPFSGFFSKDAIFEEVLKSGPAIIIPFCITVFLSAAYIFRWFFIIFRRDGSVSHIDARMKLPLPVLAVLVALGGLAAYPFLTAWGAHLSFGLATVLSVVLSGAGLLCAYLIYVKGWSIAWLSESGVAEVARARFLSDEFVAGSAAATASVGEALSWVDERIINGLIASITTFFMKSSAVVRKIVSGRSVRYLAGIIIGFIIILLYVRFA